MFQHLALFNLVLKYIQSFKKYTVKIVCSLFNVLTLSVNFFLPERCQRKTSAIALSFVDMLMSSVRSEEDDIEKPTDEIRDPEDETMRKTSLLQRFTQALFAFNTPDSSTEEELQVSKIKDEQPIVKPGSGKLNPSFFS